MSTVIAEADYGIVKFNGTNEVTVDTKVDDPSKIRLGSWLSGYFGAISGDRLVAHPSTTESPTRYEKVLIALKEDEDAPKGSNGGCVEIFLQRPNTSDDKNMIRVLTLTTSYAKFHVPIKDLQATSNIQSHTGQYQLHAQDDGNLVLYDTAQTPWVALWDVKSAKTSPQSETAQKKKRFFNLF